MARSSNPRGSGEQLRAQLVAAASALLLDPQAVALPSLRAVARECSVSPAAVYLHFDSAQSLTAAVLDAQHDGFEAAIRARIPEDAPLRVRLAAIATAYAEWGLAHPGAYQLLFESADRLDLPETDHQRWSLVDEAAQLIALETSAAPADANATAMRLWTMLHGLVSLRIHKPMLPWPPLQPELTELIARNL
tara:strand:+ start:1448 stop:2023 length:576 start_codon:yes stop_codon:yes gene_type:complete